MTDSTGAGVAGATAGAHNPTIKTASLAELEEALKNARQRELDEEPDRIVAAAERAVEKAKQGVKAAEDALSQAKKDAAELRKQRAAAAEEGTA
jgi:hypothetical protein